MPIDFTEHDLGNGLHVILHEDRAQPLVAINLWYHVGSKNEQEGKTGFAHLFEHMMFQGSKHVPPNGHFQYVQQAGGSLNASTSFDRTNYFETLPAHQLKLGLWLESDRMMSLAVNETTLETQRNVVMEERRSRYDNQPYGRMFEQLFLRSFVKAPYRWPVIGWMEDIRAATLEDVRAFHRQYYRPSNASLCLTGDFQSDDALRMIDTYFGPIPDGSSPVVRPNGAEPLKRTQVRDVLHDEVPLPALAISMIIPDLNHPDSVALDVLNHILTAGNSSRLFQRLVYRERCAQTIMSWSFGMELPGMFIIRATAQQGKSVENIEASIWDELRSIRTTGITSEELSKAKNRAEAGLVRELSSLQSRADLLNSFHILSRDTGRINRELDLVRAVTLDDLQRVASTYLLEDNGTVLHWLPKVNGAIHAT